MRASAKRLVNSARVAVGDDVYGTYCIFHVTLPATFFKVL